jgi:DNA-binding NarL/FixJ family response regulator
MSNSISNTSNLEPLLVLLIDRSPLMREAFKLILNRVLSDCLIVEAEDIEHAESKSTKFKSINLIIYHLHTIEDAVIHKTKALKIRYSNAVLLVCSGLPSTIIKSFCLAVGAESYFQHTASLDSIDFLLNSFFSATLAANLNMCDYVVLSQRQLQILKLIDQGLTNEAIAACLHIETVSIKTHLTRIFKRLNVKNRTQAVFVARKKGLL